MIPLRNLLRNKIRSILTIAGASVGIAVFVSLTLVSEGFKAETQNVIDRYSVDLTVQSKGAATPLRSIISAEDYRRLATIKGVREVASLIVGAIKTSWNPYLLILGISSAETFAARVGIIEGRLPVHGKREGMMGDVVAGSLDYHVNEKVVLMDGETFRISGIFQSESKLVASGLILDAEDARRLLKMQDSFNMAFIQLKREAEPSEVAERINKSFPTLMATRTGEFIGQVRVFRVVNASAWTISIIALVASCIVVMNTLVMAVSERTKEIGILMAIGWSRIMIIKTIIVEAVIICFAGGVVGYALGILQLFIFSWINPEGIGWWASPSWSYVVFIKALCISLGIGVFSSLYPAYLSTRLMPAEALRFE
jgi:putative ABC transport system permease protein